VRKKDCRFKIALTKGGNTGNKINFKDFLFLFSMKKICAASSNFATKKAVCGKKM
jgi:hypothetical protein